MKFTRYLKESVKLFVFYILLMTFILLTIYFDRQNRMLTSNLFYIIIVSVIMFIIYVAIDYFTKCQHIKKLLQLEASKDKTPILPKSTDYKDELYSALIDNLYEDYMKSIKTMETEFKENADFMTAWVHEIKTPITTSKLIIQCDKDIVSDNTLQSLLEEVDKIDDYVEKVLYYSRSDNFSKDYIISETNISKIVKESVKNHSLIFIKKRIRLANEIPETFTVDTDKKWLFFIVNQLLSNSLKYTDKDGSITFKVFENDKEKLLIVEDNGTGIKSEDLKKIFTKSFTGYNGRNENLKATGMGLYLSQKLAKKLSHYITIESEYGIGTKVTIHFPKWDDYYDVRELK